MKVPLAGDLVLASASPRRRRLLEEAGLRFEVVPAGAKEEVQAGLSPREQAVDLAARKALEVWTRRPDAWVLGADTLVVLAGEILGKPADREEAREMLRALSGREHEVITGVVLCGPEGSCEEFAEVTRVVFRPISASEIEEYLENEREWGDKAGGYGIQGSAADFVVRCEGSWSNVVGLPLERVLPLLRRMLNPGQTLVDPGTES